MTQKVRLTCPLVHKYVELWGGAAVVALGGVIIALDPSHWASVVLGVLTIGAGLALVWHGLRAQTPVLEIDGQEFCYIRGRYVVRIPFSEIGSFTICFLAVSGRWACATPRDGPRHLPVGGRPSAGRPYLPLTAATSPAKVEAFMNTAGIPPRDRSITAGA